MLSHGRPPVGLNEHDHLVIGNRASPEKLDLVAHGPRTRPALSVSPNIPDRARYAEMRAFGRVRGAVDVIVRCGCSGRYSVP